jgi:predicted glycosyltransferase
MLPELFTDPYFKNLHSPTGETLESIREVRGRRLHALLREETPDVFLIELYPIGRKAFRFELDPLLDEIATGKLPRCKVVCSVRDILVEKEDQARHETRAVDSLNRWCDARLVHADPDVIRLDATFSRMEAIRIPIVYTGFVAPPVAPVGDRAAWREARGISPEQTLIVVSAGGGAVGYPLLDAVTRVLPHLPDDRSLRVQVFTGPFMPAENIAQLNRRRSDRLRIDRFASDFPAWLHAADLSVSMAGYNTCMNILATGVPALVLPFDQNREQGLRARLLEDRGLLGVLSTDDLNSPGLADRIAQGLQSPRQEASGAVDINGAAHTARWITEIMPHETSIP